MKLAIRDWLSDGQARYLEDALKVYGAGLMEFGVDGDDWTEGEEARSCLELIEGKGPAGPKEIRRICGVFNEYRFWGRHFRDDVDAMGAAKTLGVEGHMALSEEGHKKAQKDVAKALRAALRGLKEQESGK